MPAGHGILFSLAPILPMSNVQIGPTLVAMSTFSNKATPVTHTEYYQSTTCAMCSNIYCTHTHTFTHSVSTTKVFHKSPTFAISNCLRCSANAGGVFNAMHTQKYGRCTYTMHIYIYQFIHCIVYCCLFTTCCAIWCYGHKIE